MSNPELVQVLRGEAVESVHRGALAIVDADGVIALKLGDVERPIFPRSACKVLQALPLVESGAADAFGLNDDELALACASHGGEPRHVAAAAAMLAKAGLSAAALECGAHWPSFDGALKDLAREGREPSALHNNCSGKHAGFVCLGCMLARGQGAEASMAPADFVRGYLQPGHAVMREVTASLQSTTGADLAKAPVGTDGCSIPTFGIALRSLALAFARVGTGVGLRPGQARAARRLREAVARSPYFVAGSGRFDTRVMERLGERVFCKVGAEGVYCAALPEAGLGVAIKIDDGNNARAAEVVMAAVIEARVGLDDAEQVFMRGFSDTRQHNWNGIHVATLRAAAALRQGVAAAAPG